jgi:predicted Zn-dependent protease
MEKDNLKNRIKETVDDIKKRLDDAIQSSNPLFPNYRELQAKKNVDQNTWKGIFAQHSKEFKEDDFKDYINQLKNEDKIKALNILACNIRTTDPNFNSLLNQISNFK